MNQRADSIHRMRIATPCHVGWENMTGDDKVRFCDQCSLHVYDISQMTSDEAKSFIAKAEGRICARLYRRADGTVITRDCPVGLRALRKRLARRAGAILTATLSLCSVVLGQTRGQEGKPAAGIGITYTKRTTLNVGESIFSGVIIDPTGGVVAGAKITLVNEHTKKSVTGISTDDGEFKLSNLAPGRYTLVIGTIGLKPQKQKHIEINPRELVSVDITLKFDGATVTVGFLLDTSEFETSNGTTIIRGDMIRRFPL